MRLVGLVAVGVKFQVDAHVSHCRTVAVVDITRDGAGKAAETIRQSLCLAITLVLVVEVIRQHTVFIIHTIGECLVVVAVVDARARGGVDGLPVCLTVEHAARQFVVCGGCA